MNTQNDILEVKPSLWGISLNVNALVRRIFPSRRDPAAVAAKRFLQVFREHGVQPTQIQRFLPEITLDRLESDAALRGALTGEVLDRTSEFFGVRREWLEGADDQIYPYRSCYQRPRSFFEDLASINAGSDAYPVRALYCGNLSRNTQTEVVLVLVSKVGQIGDDDVCRYRIYSDAWDWSYGPGRIQLKAMVRVFNLRSRTPVPLFRIPPAELTAIRKGHRIPDSVLSGCPITDPSLEDFAMAKGSDKHPGESMVAKETEELPAVLEYVKRFDLNAAWSPHPSH